MRKTKIINIRVTPEQYERIKNKAHTKGYTTMSAFILRSVLDKDLLFEERFHEMYRIITKKRNSNLTLD